MQLNKIYEEASGRRLECRQCVVVDRVVILCHETAVLVAGIVIVVPFIAQVLC